MQFNKADRAALLRGTDPYEVRGFYDLLRTYPDFSPRILATAAPLVAEVREDNNKKLGIACRGVVNERHLRRALAARDRDDLVHHLRRIVRMIGRAVSTDDLVKTVGYWGDNRRRQLAQDYFYDKQEENDDNSSPSE